jgi:hypothetical protein
MAEALIGKLLADDEAARFGGRAYMASLEAKLRRRGEEFTSRAHSGEGDHAVRRMVTT